MWQRFTERARRVIFFAQEEAGRLADIYVSTEHILLGIVRENDSVASRILDDMGISLGLVRSEIERQVTQGDGRLGQDMQLTPRAKRVIDLAYDEARQLGNNYIGTEHLLLGLIREGEGLAGRVLAKLGADLERTREHLRELQDQRGKSTTDTGFDAPADSANTGEEPQTRHRTFVRESSPARVADILQGRPIQPDIGAMTVANTIVQHQAAWRSKSLVTLRSIDVWQIRGVLAVARGLRYLKNEHRGSIRFAYPKTLALLFEKQSLRTRVSFEAGMAQLGGHAIHLPPADVGLGTRESVPDVAAALSRWVDCIAARVYKHETVEELAVNASIPVINALSDLEHPCQAFADLMTIEQYKPSPEKPLKLAYVGDGNNVLHSLLFACAKVGIEIVAACPAGYEPNGDIVEAARIAAKSAHPAGAGAVALTADPIKAVTAADVVYTDVWTSMGQEAEKEERLRVFAPYQVNTDLLSHAKQDAIVLHCLPAHRGEEITDEVMRLHRAPILDQAENRMHTQKALLALILGI